MWWFKKKVKDKPVCIKVSQYKHYEDRFIVEVHKDKHRCKISVFDKWSRKYVSDKDRDRNYLLCNDTIFDINKDVDKITEAIKIEAVVESAKDRLRSDFTKNWNKELKPKKKRIKKKKVK